jgi:hypothetical protein
MHTGRQASRQDGTGTAGLPGHVPAALNLPHLTLNSSGSPEPTEKTGFLLEFIPVKTGAGMTNKGGRLP